MTIFSNGQPEAFERMTIFLERITQAVRTDSLGHSKGWHLFFERITLAVRMDTKSLEKPFTTISNFVWHEIREICVRVAQCIKVGNGPLKSHCHENKNYRPLGRSCVCLAYAPVGAKDSDDDSPPLIMIIVRCKLFFLFISWEPTIWPANNCLQIMVCSCAMSSNCVSLQIIFCSYVNHAFLLRAIALAWKWQIASLPEDIH